MTLYVTPVFYTYLDEFQRRFQRKPTVPCHTGQPEAVELPKPAEAVTRG